MQIIQGIREKGAAIIIVVIALSLIGFILMDAKQGTGKMFGSNSTTIGKVNGSSIDRDEFTKAVEIVEAQQQQNGQSRPSNAQQAQIREQVWNKMVAEKIFYAEADKLGITLTSKELWELLYSNEPGNPFKQDKSMLDQMGNIDRAKVDQVRTNFKKLEGERREYVNAQIMEPQKLASVSGKYYALLNASTYYPSWMEEADTKSNTQFANVSYVAVPYNVIPDSTVKVTDAEISAYVQKHKSLFKQEAGRTISYVSFLQNPDGNDSARVLQQITALKAGFESETNTRAFLAKSGSTIEFDTNYVPKSRIRSTMADTIVKQPIGTVFGPFIDGTNYTLAKVLGTKMLPDSVKARHILIATIDPQTEQPILADSSAKKTADSLLAAINAGSDFALLAMQYNNDASKMKGGDLGTFGYGAMVPEFNDVAFNKPVGTRQVVKTKFGFHILEVMAHKGSSPAYKVAILAQDIQPSTETITKANLEANKLSEENDPKKFDAYIAKNGLKKVTLPILIKENDASISDRNQMNMYGQQSAPIFEDARPLVRWLFEAKKGDVSEAFNMDGQFVVAIVDNIYKEGTQDVATARPMAENAVRNEKRAAEITKKLGATPTLESAAAAYGKTVMTAGQDSSITFNGQIRDIGPEPMVTGAIFNKDYQSKVSAPIQGKTGVYVIKVNSIAARALTPDQVAAIRKEKVAALSSHLNMWFESLRKKATIKDYRSDFY